MSNQLRVTVTRNGVSVGTFNFEEVIDRINAGDLHSTDTYWHSGMLQASTLQNFLQLAEDKKRAAMKEQRDATTAVRISEDDQKTERSDAAFTWGCGAALTLLGASVFMLFLSQVAHLWSSKRVLTVGDLTKFLAFLFVLYLVFRLGSFYESELKAGTSKAEVLKAIASIVMMLGAFISLSLFLMYLFRDNDFINLLSGW